MTMMRGREGFTLIELLIVVVIIGILASIAMAGYSEMKQKAYISTLKADLRSLAVQQELYHKLHHTYADESDIDDYASSEAVTVEVTEATGTGWAATGVHEAMEDFQCGLFTGEADPASAPPATVSGVVACEDI